MARLLASAVIVVAMAVSSSAQNLLDAIMKIVPVAPSAELLPEPEISSEMTKRETPTRSQMFCDENGSFAMILRASDDQATRVLRQSGLGPATGKVYRVEDTGPDPTFTATTTSGLIMVSNVAIAEHEGGYVYSSLAPEKMSMVAVFGTWTDFAPFVGRSTELRFMDWTTIGGKSYRNGALMISGEGRMLFTQGTEVRDSAGQVKRIELR